MKNLWLCIFVLLLAACSGGPARPMDTPYPTQIPYPTYTAYPTYTPLPTYTPYPTQAGPTMTPRPTMTATLAPDVARDVGTLEVNSWLFEITEARLEAGMDETRRNVLLFGNITNKGNTTDQFNSFGLFVLTDSKGRTYDEDLNVTFAAVEKYDTGLGVGINPEAKEYICIGFDVPASERTFTISSGYFTTSWSGDITFSFP